MVHTVVVCEVKLTGSPEVATAFNETASPTNLGEIGPNVMLWLMMMSGTYEMTKASLMEYAPIAKVLASALRATEAPNKVFRSALGEASSKVSFASSQPPAGLTNS
jgi:hypothetical protein